MPKVPQKTIYVREEDVELWERAVAYAKARRLPVSSLLMNALQEYFERREAGRQDDVP
jgi:hypothetical protein